MSLLQLCPCHPTLPGMGCSKTGFRENAIAFQDRPISFVNTFIIYAGPVGFPKDLPEALAMLQLKLLRYLFVLLTLTVEAPALGAVFSKHPAKLTQIKSLSSSISKCICRVKHVHMSQKGGSSVFLFFCNVVHVASEHGFL